MNTHTNLKTNQSGIAHLALILLFVVVIGAVGAVGYRVYQSNNKSDESATILSAGQGQADDGQDTDTEITPPTDNTTDEVDVEAVAPNETATN